jgi:hypothetical protein
MDTGERFTVEVRPISESSRWCWEIWDTVRGEVVEGCWPSDWTAYDSREAALRAGQLRLTLKSPPEGFHVVQGPDDRESRSSGGVVRATTKSGKNANPTIADETCPPVRPIV